MDSFTDTSNGTTNFYLKYCNNYTVAFAIESDICSAISIGLVKKKAYIKSRNVEIREELKVVVT